MIFLALFSSFAVTSIQYVCYLYEENKSGSSVNELGYRMFTEKKLSENRLPSTLDALVLHLRQALTFFLNSFTSFVKNIQHNMEKNFPFA